MSDITAKDAIRQIRDIQDECSQAICHLDGCYLNLAIDKLDYALTATRRLSERIGAKS